MSAVNAVALLAAAGGDYQISRSVRLRSSAAAYLSRTFVSGNRQILTWNGWVKRGKLGSQQGLMYVNDGVAGTPRGGFFFNADDTFTFSLNTSGSSFNVALTTTQVFRDLSAWYMVTVAVDTTDATSSNRVKIYINGVQVTAFSAATYPTLNVNTPFNTTYTYLQGSTSAASSNFDGYLTEVNFIDGQALTPSSFGETDIITGVWKPKKYAGTYGTNGFYLNFSDNSAATAAAIGKDWSGNGNNWMPNNISVTAGATYDSMLDVPTMYADGGNGRGNYCVLNPLKVSNAAPVSDGNLRFLGVSVSFVESIYGTMGVTGSGKYYFEVTGAYLVGFNNSDVNAARDQTTGRVTYHGGSGFISVGATTVQSGLATAYNNTDVVGVALNLDASTIAFYKNSTQLGTNVSISAASTWWPFIQNTTTYYSQVNFGQRPFAYTPPTGFKALNTQNLPEATIKKGNAYFDATTYTGNGSNQTITNAGFQPDLFWGKSRSAVNNHGIVDSVRGGTAALYSNLTNAEGADGIVNSFNSNGVSIGNSATTNTNGQTYVGWQWKESASAGFDIVTYAGNGANRTIAHSLGVAPSMIIVKRRDAAGYSWIVGLTSLGWANFLVLNATTASQAASTVWNNTAPTSSVFSLGTDTFLNANAGTYVAYLFSEVAGFSKFGSYTGNGSADGPFAYLGFRPRFVMIKRTDSTGNWQIIDTERVRYNEDNAALYPNLSNAEDLTNTKLDALANGFKIRGTPSTDFNTSGSTYIYAAFAENPFKNSLAR